MALWSFIYALLITIFKHGLKPKLTGEEKTKGLASQLLTDRRNFLIQSPGLGNLGKKEIK